MRHKVFGKKLGRDIKERKALFKNLIIALIINGKIKTTYSRAKAIARLAEKLVTKAKNGSNGALRQLESFLTKKDAIHRLKTVIAPQFKDKIGGYVRMVRLGIRRGDSTEEVRLEWTNVEMKVEKLGKQSTQRAVTSPKKAEKVHRNKQSEMNKRKKGQQKKKETGK